MEIVRKFGLWLIAAVLILLAIGLHFTIVRKAAGKRTTEISNLKTRRDKLEKHYDKRENIPGPDWIAFANEEAARITRQLDQCAKYLAAQPRNGHRRLFFLDEHAPVSEEADIADPMKWLALYKKYGEELRRQIEDAGLFEWNLSLPEPWGANNIPIPEEIHEVQELYWFKKDFADALTDQVEKEFAEFLTPPPDDTNRWPSKPSDLVISRSVPGEPEMDESLRWFSHDKLAAVIETILINEENQDLATIFNQYLSSEDDAHDYSWDRRVLKVTMDDDQARYLEDLVPPENDLANRKRFKDYVTELRSVRYRSDVIGLLENHDDSNNRFADVAARVKDVSLEGRAKLRKEIREEWSATRIAQTIATIVTIKNETDYHLLRNNHNPQIADIREVRIDFRKSALGGLGPAQVRGRPGRLGPTGLGPGPGRGPAGREPTRREPGKSSSTGTTATTTKQSDPYNIFEFGFMVKIEFEHLPVFLRRLLSNSWRYKITVKSIKPAETRSLSGRGLTGSRERTVAGMRPSPRRAAGTAREEEMPSVLRNYVWVTISGEGYQFTPLLAQLKGAAREKTALKPEQKTPAGKPGDRSTAPKPDQE